jgi:hypothetical protein
MAHRAGARRCRLADALERMRVPPPSGLRADARLASPSPAAKVATPEKRELYTELLTLGSRYQAALEAVIEVADARDLGEYREVEPLLRKSGVELPGDVAEQFIVAAGNAALVAPRTVRTLCDMTGSRMRITALMMDTDFGSLDNDRIKLQKSSMERLSELMRQDLGVEDPEVSIDAHCLQISPLDSEPHQPRRRLARAGAHPRITEQGIGTTTPRVERFSECSESWLSTNAS